MVVDLALPRLSAEQMVMQILPEIEKFAVTATLVRSQLVKRIGLHLAQFLESVDHRLGDDETPDFRHARFSCHEMIFLPAAVRVERRWTYTRGPRRLGIEIKLA